MWFTILRKKRFLHFEYTAWFTSLLRFWYITFSDKIRIFSKSQVAAIMSLSQLSQIKGPSISYLWFFPFSISNLNKRVMTNHLRWCVFKTFQGRKVSNSSKTSRYFIFQMAMRHSKQWETNKVASLIFREIDFWFKLLFSVFLRIVTLCEHTQVNE